MQESTILKAFLIISLFIAGVQILQQFTYPNALFGVYDEESFDDLLKAAEAADKELKEKQEQENEAKKESTSTEKPKTTKSGKSSTKTTKSKQKRK